MKVTVYRTAWCGYCFAASALLADREIPYEEIYLDGNRELREATAARAGGWRTVPMIFAGERFIGGYQELRAELAKGELLELESV